MNIPPSRKPPSTELRVPPSSLSLYENRLNSLNMADANEQLKALDAAFASRSIIAVRFLVHQTHDLRGRNAAFS
eukprot:5845698-Pleurochrysis_carterae.AAC.1